MSAESVVSNAGPLIAFAKLNLLHLLKALYREVRFTRAVYDEVVVAGMQRGYEDASILDRFLTREGWQPVVIAALPEDLAGTSLDRGELESIALALAGGGVLLIDEERGRAEARRRGIATRGTLGVLIQAYRAGLIDSDQLRFYFDQIAERSDLWISPALCQRLLDEVLGAER